MPGINQPPPSLRTRYYTTTLILVIIALGVVSYFYRDAVSTKYTVNKTYEVIQNKKRSQDQIRVNLLKIYLNLDFFLLDPLNKEGIKQIDALIADSIRHAMSLAGIDSHDKKNYIGPSQSLVNHFSELERQIIHLAQVRLDINQQYPGLALSANEMPDFQGSIISGLQLLIDEIETGGLDPQNKRLYPLLIKTYSIWISEISQMRIYLANRLASFSEDILQRQGNSVLELKNQFDENIEAIEKLYQDEDSFEAITILERIKTDSSKWYDIFAQVRSISESDSWRADTHFLESNIIPHIDSIIGLMDNIDDALNHDHSKLSEKLRRNSDRLSLLIIAIIALFVFFIGGIIVSLDRMVFRPINNVSQALLSRALDFEHPQLEYSNTREIGGLINAFQEMDNEVTQRQNDLEHQAMHDHLTGLPNRSMLTQRVDYQILSAERKSNDFALLLMDLDNFKEINDTLGHDAGDILLVSVAKRIQSVLRKSDTFARFGGDEFCLLLPDTDMEGSSNIAAKIIEKLNDSFSINNHKVNIGISIGIVRYPVDGNDCSTLLQRADTAMYVAKRKRAGTASYDPEEDIYSTERLSLINDLVEAIEKNSLMLHFQPRFETKTRTIVGAEALLRWHHTKFGVVPTDKIIELAEHTGTIQKLTFWVLDNAISQCASWHRNGHPIIVAVNLSAQDLYNEELAHQIEKLLNKNKLHSRYLILEITESVMMENIGHSLRTLKKLSEMGLHLSIDDFGTGFSSLSYLKRFPVSELKIDKSFIIGMLDNHNDQIIVRSTINMGHDLGLIVVAEGVEDADILASISEMGCDYFQGYYLGKPDSSERLIATLEKKEYSVA